MPDQDVIKELSDIVTHSYHTLDVNCAKTTLIALGRLFEQPLQAQTLQAATALNGGGRSREQCGLVEGALMFLGMFYAAAGVSDRDIEAIARDYLSAFKSEFGSISCYDLRPGGFQKNDPPHKCEGLTLKSIAFAYDFLQKRGKP